MNKILPIKPPSSMWETVFHRISGNFLSHESSPAMRILFILVMAGLSHVAVKLVHHLSAWLVGRTRQQKEAPGIAVQRPKAVTVIRLTASTTAFLIYFVAIGLVLQQFGFSLTAYLASASVVGLAISFGSQGLVQDIVIGLTLIFWDAMDVNDMVEITGPTISIIGRVDEIGMRFTKVINFYNQKVFVPNRTIGNISRFPHGGVDAYADPQIPAAADEIKIAQTISRIALGMWAQFGAILGEPVIGKVECAQDSGWKFVRVHFRIWPGQGGLIETTFRQEVVKAMKAIDPLYADWQVPVTYRAGLYSQNAKPHPLNPSIDPA